MSDWFIIQCNPQGEKKAVGELRRAGFRVYMPRTSKEVIHKRTKQPMMKRGPVLKGYLFLRFPAHLYDRRGIPPFAIARACQGVRDFLKAANANNEWEPFAVPDTEVIAFMRRERVREFGPAAPARPEQRRKRLEEKFHPGAQVRIAIGPFENFIATVEKLTSGGTVEAEVMLFGRVNKVSFADPEQSLRTVDSAREAA